MAGRDEGHVGGHVLGRILEDIWLFLFCLAALALAGRLAGSEHAAPVGKSMRDVWSAMAEVGSRKMGSDPREAHLTGFSDTRSRGLR